jgi:hypothetical protein
MLWIRAYGGFKRETARCYSYVTRHAPQYILKLTESPQMRSNTDHSKDVMKSATGINFLSRICYYWRSGDLSTDIRYQRLPRYKYTITL